MSIPTLGGSALFGVAVHITPVPNANAAQVASFFGVSGVQAMDGGQRGRIFEVTGVMTGASPAGVYANETLLELYADGLTRTLVDTTGTIWANVVYRNEFQWSDKFMWLSNLACWGRPYRLVLHALT